MTPELLRVRVKGSRFDHVALPDAGSTLCGRVEWRPILAARVRKARICGACSSLCRITYGMGAPK